MLVCLSSSRRVPKKKSQLLSNLPYVNTKILLQTIIWRTYANWRNHWHYHHQSCSVKCRVSYNIFLDWPIIKCHSLASLHLFMPRPISSSSLACLSPCTMFSYVILTLSLSSTQFPVLFDTNPNNDFRLERFVSSLKQIIVLHIVDKNKICSPCFQ